MGQRLYEVSADPSVLEERIRGLEDRVRALEAAVTALAARDEAPRGPGALLPPAG